MNNFVLAAISLLGLMGHPGFVRPEEPKSGSPEELLKLLGSGAQATRERAGERLAALGPTVLPALRTAAHRADPEVRKRIQEIIGAVEAAALAPRRVTLDARQMQPSLALKIVARQTAFPLPCKIQGGPGIDLKLEAVPFWEALESIARILGCTVAADPFDTTLMTAGRASPHVSFSGPFRVEATSLVEDRNIDLGSRKPPGDHSGRIVVTLSALAEPRFLIMCRERARVVSAVDDTGQSLVPSAPSSTGKTDLILDTAGCPCGCTSEAVLRRPAAKAKSLRELRGVIPVVLALEGRPVLVTENVLKSAGTKFQVGGQTLKLIKAGEEDGGYGIHLRVPPTSDGVREFWHALVRLEDAQGNEYEPKGGGDSWDGDWHSINNYYWREPNLGPPARLIVRDIIKVQCSIPFVFRDLPLP